MHEVRLLQMGDEQILHHVAEGVFDNPIDSDLTAKYLANPHNHIAVAIEDDVVVGFASGLDYIHPDKKAQMWINEVGVAPTHRRRGIGRAVLAALTNLAREIGCTEAWVLTETDNDAARGLYKNAGGVEERTVLVAFPLAEKDESR